MAGPLYQDSTFYPFLAPHQRHGYGEQPYQDNPPWHPESQQISIKSNVKEPKSSFDHFDSPREELMGTGIKGYRRRTHGRTLWTRGGSLWCLGRFFFCSLLIIIYLLVVLILGLALWLRPPALSFTNPGLDPDQQINLGTTLTVPLELNITVNNPNFFAVDFKTLSAEVAYPDVDNTLIAEGNLTNLVIKSNEVTNFTFPINISLNLTDEGADGNDLNVVLDLADKCGIIPSGPKSPIPLAIKIWIGLSILGIKITLPSISFTVNINCPIDNSEIEQKLQGILGDL
ncbi:hypothetical protein J3R30DRAFT_3399579 [Lentinula aciculospora]|uniref:Late embryogenesis abundant protein LEA-2 subgroup domain-containing protein n=1 Tax=Lentinula aciculospora TaxID=153920 RepID=A0A9W9DXY4_9AGAR|nr:hypothetical protein J3R30DRAFT_3399579 [Lentinula aciculospora]